MVSLAENWKLAHTLGDKPLGTLVDGDVVSAVEFDEPSGQYLATGDRGGRVRIYERNNISGESAGPSSPTTRRTLVSAGGAAAREEKGPAFEYKLWHEFQSHEAEFDYLKSLEIEEKINCLRWCKPMNSAFQLLTTNDKTIKLCKVSDKKKTEVAAEYKVGGKNVTRSSGALPQAPGLTLPRLGAISGVGADDGAQHDIQSRVRRVFANGHAYHINSISLNSDRETFISADDLRINLWNLGISDTSFNIVDIKPTNMEELTEVITAASCHPDQCNVFLWSNSRGSIKLADMRDRALCDTHAKVFEEEDDPSRRSFFSEIISSIADVKFSRDGRHILSRDYMCLKLWDVNMEAKPIRTIYVHEQLRSKLCDLYENDAIFDKFQCSFSGDAKWLLTGSYHNYLHIYDRIGKGDVCIEASKTPKKRLANKGRLNLPRPKTKKLEENGEMDMDKKVLHCAWHPTEPCVAVGACNTVYIYHNDEAKLA